MNWTLFDRDPWQPLEDLWRAIDRGAPRAAAPSGSIASTASPQINAWVGPEDALVTSELPGVAAEDVHVAVEGDTLKLSGERKPLTLGEGERYHRRERGTGQFSRALKLPFRVDNSAVEASFERGVLTVRLPRAKEDLPRRIQVKSA